MSYTWTNGELITAEKLNDTGGEDSKFDVTVVDLTGEKLSAEDADAFAAAYTRTINEDTSQLIIGFFGVSNGANQFGKLQSASVGLGGYTGTFVNTMIDMNGSTPELFIDRRTASRNTIDKRTYRCVLTLR